MSDTPQSKPLGYARPQHKESAAATPEEALAKALHELNRNPDDVTFEVLEKGSKGFLGVGRREARILVHYDEIEPVEQFTQRIMEQIFASLPLTITIQCRRQGNAVIVEMTGDDMQYLTQDRSYAISSLQYLLSLIIRKYVNGVVRIHLEVPRLAGDSDLRARDRKFPPQAPRRRPHSSAQRPPRQSSPKPNRADNSPPHRPRRRRPPRNQEREPRQQEHRDGGDSRTE